MTDPDGIEIRSVAADTMAVSVFSHTFLQAADLQGRSHTLAIKDVRVADLPKDGGGRETKPLVDFERARLPWLVNKTNACCLIAMFGDRFSDWKGKRVTIHAETVRVGKETKPAIRVVGSPDIAGPMSAQVPAGRKVGVRQLLKTTAAPAATTESAEPTTTPEAE